MEKWETCKLSEINISKFDGQEYIKIRKILEKMSDLCYKNRKLKIEELLNESRIEEFFKK